MNRSAEHNKSPENQEQKPDTHFLLLTIVHKEGQNRYIENKTKPAWRKRLKIIVGKLLEPSYHLENP